MTSSQKVIWRKFSLDMENIYEEIKYCTICIIEISAFWGLIKYYNDLSFPTV